MILSQSYTNLPTYPVALKTPSMRQRAAMIPWYCLALTNLYTAASNLYNANPQYQVRAEHESLLWRMYSTLYRKQTDEYHSLLEEATREIARWWVAADPGVAAALARAREVLEVRYAAA